MTGYSHRAEAGETLAGLIGPLPEDAVVLGIPRGGIPVAAPVARRAGIPLAALVAVKVRAPRNEEFAIGAVTPDGVPLLDQPTIGRLGIGSERVGEAVADAVAEVERRQSTFGPPPALADRTVVVVDDGVATGATVEAALLHARRQDPAHLVCAIPVGPPQTVRRLADQVDRMVCPLRPRSFRAVGEFYRRFDQVSDEEVVSLLG